MPPDRGLADKASAGVKGKKTRLTYAFTANADGTEKLPAFVIGKAKKPRCFLGKTGEQLGFRYRNNAKAWMTAHLYQEWLSNWDQELVAKNRKQVLLLQDNFTGHIPPSNLRAIRVENFEPNLTSHVQPNDQGIIRCFKAHYRAKFIERAINRYDSNVTPTDIYDIDQLQAMRLADAAWREVDTTTIRHCWRKAGILPPDMESPQVAEPRVPISSLIHGSNTPDVITTANPITQAEREVKLALDGLRARGALQASNIMSIERLLNAPEETSVEMDITEAEILEAVREARAAEESGEFDGEDPVTIEPPTRSEVLQAVGLLTRFLDVTDDPVARKLEGVLATFSRQIRIDIQRTMVPTEITDFFVPK